jgi:hypothetical protein
MTAQKPTKILRFWCAASQSHALKTMEPVDEVSCDDKEAKHL